MHEIDSLEVNPKSIAALKVAKIIDFKSILLLSHGELIKATKLSNQEVSALIKAVSQKVLQSKLVTSLQLPGKDQKFSFGCKSMDDLFRGGILTRGITEICGESASGKTQICLQLSLFAQLPVVMGGLACGVLYICTECSFPIKRLHQLIRELSALRAVGCPAQATFCDNITICQIGDVCELKQCVQKYLPVLAKARQIKVVIIDSVAAVFRAGYEKNETYGRAEDLQAVGYSLHCLSQKEHLAVVCVNQVTDTMSGSHHWCGPMEKVAPALGLSWANMVTTRLMLSRTSQRIESFYENGREVSLPSPAVVCKAKIVYSPDLPNECAYYAVTGSGVKSIELQTINRRREDFNA